MVGQDDFGIEGYGAEENGFDLEEDLLGDLAGAFGEVVGLGVWFLFPYSRGRRWRVISL